ncbi:MAG: polysaccharide lyase family 8 super-sandwich domain-containing protein [Pedobacter sp.]
MKQYLFLCIALIFQATIAKGQIHSANFNTSIPSNWSVTDGVMALSNEHLKGGANALKWTPQKNSVLTAGSLNIWSGTVGGFSTHTAELFIYSSQASTDTLVLKFLDNNNVVHREGRMLLNYKGWRSYHRSYRYDYNNGAESNPFTLNKIEIVYKPSSTTTNTIYLDELTFVGNNTPRVPGPHMALDIHHFQLATEYDKAYAAWANQPDIPLSTASAAEQTAIAALKMGTYQRSLGTVTAQQITDAKTYVTQCGITTNPDGSLRGRGISAIYNIDTLLKISGHVQSLARAYGLNGDNDALAKLRTFVSFLEEQGLAEGGEIVIPYNNYTGVRNFPVGFLEALPYIADADSKLAVIKMLKWSHEFNTIYYPDAPKYLNIDFVYLKSRFLVELALLSNSDDEIARDLKSFSRYLEKFTYPRAGAEGGIKPDGVGFHHNSQHIAYLYSYAEWINRTFELKGTPFKISQTGYDNMKGAMKALFLETSKGAIYPHSASGRSPFPNSVPVNTTAFDRLVQVGGDLVGAAVEPDLAAFYNYIFQTNRYAVSNVNGDGFYQLNYAQTGILRRNNWIAVSRGFTSKMFGAEIYSNANRYGRYQSYGALEVLYDGSLPNTGYVTGGAGWDWNMMPGTTSVRQSYDNLKPSITGTSTEFQGSDFAGALADGKTGIFGMEFIQSSGTRYTSSGLNFRKSVFALDSVMVSVGTNISATNAADPTITTLFQGINAGSNPAIYINSATATTANYDQALSGTTANWLINGQTTGFYIPAGNPDISIFRGSQTTPINTTDNTATTATANVSKAWFSHGTAPTAAKYSYVTVPATTPQKMAVLATKIENNQLFTILSQTETLHAVKYLPINATYFNAFAAAPAINIGYLKGVSGRALFSIRESGDSLIVKIASPDLNAVSNPLTDWISTTNNITLSLTGNWTVHANSQNAGIVNGQNSLDATFALKDGFSQTLVLLKDQLTQEEMPGVWTNQVKKWSYNLSTGTGLAGFGTPPVYQQGSPVVVGTNYSHSTSSATTPGFLPYPPDGLSRVHIVNNNTLGSNGNFTLNAAEVSLLMSASSLSSVNKFSAFEVANATPITNMFFRISFADNANNGSFIYALGNKAAGGNLFSNSSGVHTATTDLFTALQWNFTASGISFNFRESASTSGGTYRLISNTAFSKGGTYDVEVYGNNSAVMQSYTREGLNYDLQPGKFNIWVRPADQLVRSSLLTYNSSAAFSASGELAQGSNVNSFLFQGINSTLPTPNAAVIKLANIEMNFASIQTLPVQMVSFTGQAKGNAVSLNWKTASETDTDKFTLYRSTDGKNFEQLTELKAAGNSSQTVDYAYRDTTLPINMPLVYYRLKLTDKDGSVSYDHIVDVKLSLTTEGVVLYPNPVSSTLNISYPVNKAHKAVVRIADMSGKTVHSSTHQVIAGVQQLSIDVSALPKGVYLVRVADTVNKIVKL